MTARRRKKPAYVGGAFSKAAGAAVSATEAKARPWAAWLMGMALLAAVTAWGYRETKSSEAVRLATEAESSAKKRLSHEAEARKAAERDLRKWREAAETAKSALRQSKHCRKWQGSDGSSFEDCSEQSEEVTELISSMTERTVQLERELESARALLGLVSEGKTSTATVAVSAKSESVTHKGGGLLLGGSYDLGRLGDPNAEDPSRRVRVEGGLWWANFEAALSVKPMGAFTDSNEADPPKDWRERVARMAPALRGAVRF